MPRPGAKFVVKEAAGKFHFNLIAPNGEVVATSELYVSLENCLKGIKAVKKYAGKAKVEK